MKPIVVQHSFGDVGSGGPEGALTRLLASPMRDRYEFVRMHQNRATGQVDISRIRAWALRLRQIQPDIVHVRGLGNEGFHGVAAAKLAGCPRILLSVHGSVRDLQQAPRNVRWHTLVKVIEPLSLRLATHVAAVSRDAAGRPFLRGLGPKFIGVVPNGVVIPDEAVTSSRDRMRRSLRLDPTDVAMVVVGRLTKEKGHLILAEALKLLPTPPSALHLLIIGDGPDESLIRDAYTSVEKVKIHFLGRRLDVPSLLAASDIFVFPTLHENLSNALLEGMAARLPIVASSVGGNVEVLSGGGGILIPSSDSVSLANGIGRLVRNRELRRSMGEKALQTVAERYTVEAMTDGWDRVYAAMLSEGTR